MRLGWCGVFRFEFDNLKLPERFALFGAVSLVCLSYNEQKFIGKCSESIRVSLGQ